MPQHEVTEAKRLHDCAEQDNRLFVGEHVVEGHESDSHNAMSKVSIVRSDSVAASDSVAES